MSRQPFSVWVPIVFLVFVFLTGGGARSDIASLPLLRGGAVLFAFWAALQMDGSDWRRVRVPLLLLGAFTAWIGIQLIPLPPSMWHGLPGRESIVAIDRLLGQPDLWRPISLTPSQGFNSLLAMTVPFAALLVYSRGGAEDVSRLLFAIVGLACFSALLGFVQIMSGPSSGAYLYRITNSQDMVGLLANRNHHAMFLAAAVIVAAMLLRDELMRKQKRGLIRLCLGLAAVGLMAVTILIGSRAGMAAGMIAFAVGYLMVGSAWQSHGAAPRAARRDKLLLYAPLAVIGGLFGAALWASGRSTALTRLMGPDVVADMRVQAWPVVQSMIETYWVWGSGFGSFPDVYEMFEPDRLLQPSYFNHAHNDWAEILMTGGLPATVILIAAIAWVAHGVMRQGLRGLIKGHRGDMRLAMITILVLFALGSTVDYPLRVPSLQMLTVLFITLLCCSRGAATRQD